MYLLKYLGHIFIYNSITLGNRIKFTAIQFVMHIDEVNVLITTPLL